MNKNPLLEKFSTKFGSVPFKSIKDEHFLPAFEHSILEVRKCIENIKNSTQTPSFGNVIAAFEFATLPLDTVNAVFNNLKSTDTNPIREQIAKEISPKLSELANDLAFDEKLFEKVKYVKENCKIENEEQKTVLEKHYKNFVRNGVNLSAEKKSELRQIDRELSEIALDFSKKVLDDTNEYFLEITDKNDLAGLPESAIEASKMTAKEKGKDNSWGFTLQYPSFAPLITYSDKRDLREKVYRAYMSRGFNKNNNNTVSLIGKIAKLRHERAKLLGYPSHADYVQEERMAKNPLNVTSFLNDILVKASPAALRETAELQDYAKKMHNIDSLQKWDVAYYSEKLKKEKYSIDTELLRPYFKLDNMIKGLFDVAQKLYGINLEKQNDVEVYHEDVSVYEVKGRSGEHIGLLYVDLFPRESKRSGAWMTSFREQHIRDGVNVRPHISIVGNFTKPTDTKPSLLTYDEVTTLFHEFGHALHGLLSQTTYLSVAGTSVYWDFVELPSQIMENWAEENYFLENFAKHYETNEAIPSEMIKNLKKSSNFMMGRFLTRQLSFGLLDMKWHASLPNGSENIFEFEREIITKTESLPYVDGTSISTAFSHIFAGGYSAGYYSYMWADVLASDAFAYFKETGVFNSETADKFRKNILEKGGSEHPMTLYKKFRGKEPNVEALLEQKGLL